SFFFQAEDGIRARNVTGVQTCALPICLDQATQRTLACRQEDHRRRDGVRGEGALSPAVEQPAVVAAQAVDLLVGAFGAVVLDQHREAPLARSCDEGGVALQVARAAPCRV